MIPSPGLEATVAVQAAVIAEFRAANAEQARLIDRLPVRVAELERRLGKDSSNSSKPPSSDGLGKPVRVGRRADGQTARRRPGKQPGAPGADLAQVAQPDQVVWHVPERCGGCGADLANAPVSGVEAPPGVRPAAAAPGGGRAPPGGAAAPAALPSYLSTARKHGMNPLAVLRQLFQGRPWLPAPAES